MSFTVTFNGQGGNPTPISKLVEYDALYGTLATVSKTGYTFEGWFTEINGGGQQVTSVTLVSIMSNQTLYAKWTPLTFTVTFEAQDFTPDPQSKVVTYDAPYGPLTTAAKTGYVCNWFTATNGLGQQVTATNIVKITSNQTLYANWTPMSFTVTFNGQGGTPSPASKTVFYDSPYGSLATASKTGYTFSGWFTETNGNGDQVTSGSTVQTLTNQTLYAKWTPLTFTVTFEAQDFTPDPQSKVVTYDAPYGPLPTATKPGYVACWFTEPNGQGEPVTSETIVNITSFQTLYANWVVPGVLSIVPNRDDFTYQEGDMTAMYRVILSAPALQNTMVSLVAQYVVDNTSADDCLELTVTNITIGAGFTNSALFSMKIKDGTAKTTSGILIIPTITNVAAQIQYPVTQLATVFIQNVAPDIDTVPTCKPTTTALAPYNAVEIDKPFTFHYKATDITADVNGVPPVSVEFQFQDGTAVTNSGVNGTVTHTFITLGGQSVTMIARDKDGGETQLSFPVTIVPQLPPPSIRVLDKPDGIAENDSTSAKQLTIQLSQAPITCGITNPVVVYLDVTPTTNAVNGRITVPVSVTFYASQTNKTVNFTVQDGTFLSETNGFTVTPRIATGAPGDDVYIQRYSGNIRVQNVAPEFVQPIDGNTNTIATVGQPRTFTWSVRDVAADLPTMSLLWDWGDGTTSTNAGGSGSLTHTYTTTNSSFSVSVTATDKDGDSTNISFYVTVKEPKKIITLPIRPNSTGFNGLTDLGTGTIVATNASSTVWDTEDLYYSFYFSTEAETAQLEAIPTPVPLPDGKQSYFFAWDGSLDIFQDTTHVTHPLSPRSTIIILPQSGSTVTNSAIFTKEFDSRDTELPSGVNNGDLNQDGVPDRFVKRYFVDLAAESWTNATLNDIWFQNLSGVNVDEDYLPVDTSGENQGGLDFRPVAAASTNQSGLAVNAFNAFMEIRGYDGILGTDDDPGTDPTRNDTENDEYPDGWEYWFWYQSKINGRTGLRYNPNSSSQCDIIDSSEIMEAFNPLMPRSSYSNPLWRDDFDNDGILDIEELVLGTDPAKCNNIGFSVWFQAKGLTGVPAELFAEDRNSDGIQNGFEYAFGTNLPLTELLLNIRFVNGRMVVDIPKQDETTTPFVSVELKASTNLTDWTLQTIPAQDTTGKPSNRDWKETTGTLEKAFFKLKAELK
jgi:uncharacterized repeat protein (TIGR02543 family)